MKRRLPTLVQLSGVVLASVGFGILKTWAGFIAAGLLLTLVGVGLELETR